VYCEWFGAGDLRGDVTLVSHRACVGRGGDVLLAVGLARQCSWGVVLSSVPVMWRLYQVHTTHPVMWHPSGSHAGEVVGRRGHDSQ
jgi:hypothetical protein